MGSVRVGVAAGSGLKPLLSATQVAEILGCDRSTVYRMMAAGEIAWIPTRAGKRIHPDDLEAYQQALRVGTLAERRERRKVELPAVPADEREEYRQLAATLGLK